MANPDPKIPHERPSSLESLENRLYSRTPPPLRHDEEFIGEEKHIRIAPGWTSEAERKGSAMYAILATIMPWLKRLLIASIIFFFFAAGIAFYGFWRGGNTVSPQNIAIDILGPVGGGAGEELALTIDVGNDNALDLDSVDLLVEFPEGTKRPGNLTESLPRYRDSLGPIAAGEHVSREITLVPFGEEGKRKKLFITAEYRPKDSNAIFSRKAEYEFVISSAPVHFVLNMPKEINSDQTFETTIDISSNSNTVQEDLLVKAQYPFGFEFQESSPSPSFGKDSWLLGDLQPQGKRTIRIKGKIISTEESERTFRFSIGTHSKKDEKQLGTAFLNEASTVSVRRPFLTLDLLVNGEKGKTFIGRSSQIVRADVVWANNLSSKIADLEITATFNGDIYNRSSVQSQNGFYDSNTGTLVWDKRKSARFAVVEPGESGTNNFSFGILPVATDPSAFKNPTLTIELTARGKRLDEQGLYQNVESTVRKEIKIATNLTLGSRLFYADGPLQNSGPIPPKAEEETTYTITWSLTNTSNGVANTRVSAVLPSYVKWVGEVNPASETVTYNPLGGEVVWNAGEVESGDGVGTPPREVSFKIAIQPSLSQVGTSPSLIGETNAKGTDRFTGVEVTSNVRQSLTTASLSDPGASKESGKVAP